MSTAGSMREAGITLASAGMAPVTTGYGMELAVRLRIAALELSVQAGPEDSVQSIMERAQTFLAFLSAPTMPPRYADGGMNTSL